MGMFRWVLLVTVGSIATSVVLQVGFDLDSHVSAYITTGLVLAGVVGRQVFAVRRVVRGRGEQVERVGSVELDD